MDLKTLEENYRSYLDSLSLTQLRVLAREKMVPVAVNAKKAEVIQDIIDNLVGRKAPVPRSNRGAPVKQTYLDNEILRKLADIKRAYDREQTESDHFFVVEDSEQVKSIFDEQVYTGILEVMPSGYGFVRSRNCQPSAGGDVFIPAPFVHSMRLRPGDFIACTVHNNPEQRNSAAIQTLISVNGQAVGKYENRPNFDSLTACYAKQKIELSENRSELSLRLLDLFVPIGKGQRALIIAPPKAGKTTLLKDIARSISANHREITLIILLIDERPEEVTDIRESVKDAMLIYSTFDEGAERHVRAAQLTITHAKRLAEKGKDVVILLDSLTKLTRAYNFTVESSGRTLSGGLDAGAFAEPKRFFGAARNTIEAGSITIIATALVDTGSRMDDMIYEEFKGTGNSDIFLSRDLAEKRIFPAIDLRRSGTRKEEFLLNENELTMLAKLRERGLAENTAGIIEMMKKTSDNADFVAKIPEWLKVFKVNGQIP